MAVRTERPADREAVRAVVVAAFGRADEADLVEALRDDEAWIPSLSLVATDGAGAVVGHVLLTRMTVGGAAALALAPVSVDPEWQGRGVGSRLVEEGLARAEAAGEPLVVVLGDPGYYGRFGFGPAADHGVMGPFEGAGDAFAVLGLGGAEPMPGDAVYAAPFGVGAA